MATTGNGMHETDTVSGCGTRNEMRDVPAKINGGETLSRLFDACIFVYIESLSLDPLALPSSFFQSLIEIHTHAEI